MREKIDFAMGLQARRCQRSAEQKPSASSTSRRPKLFRITRQTRIFVWVRWEGYGIQRRGLSRRIPTAEFRKEWSPFPRKDSIAEPLLFFRLDRFVKLERVRRETHRYTQFFKKCEKCGERTNYEVSIFDGARWAAWCGCSP